MRSLIQAFSAVLLLLASLAAYSVPLTYRVEFVVEDIVEGCATYPCGHVGGPTFSVIFTIESDDFNSPFHVESVPLSTPLTFADGFYNTFFAIDELQVEGSFGLATALNNAAAAPLIPFQCFAQILSTCVASGGMSFIQDSDGTWFDAWRTRGIFGEDSGRVEGTYTLTLLSSVPEPGSLALFAVAFSALGWSRRKK